MNETSEGSKSTEQLAHQFIRRKLPASSGKQLFLDGARALSARVDGLRVRD